MTDPHTAGDLDALAALDPITETGTDDPPTADPPERWDPDAHDDADRYDGVELAEIPDVTDLEG